MRQLIRIRLLTLLLSATLVLAGPVLTATAYAEVDTDGDGIADVDDADDDNDGVDDLFDIAPLDPDRCEDVDADGADDCAIGTDDFGPLADNDPANDGPDCDSDGIVDAGDADADGNGVLDTEQDTVCVTIDVVVSEQQGDRVFTPLDAWHATISSSDGATEVAFVTDTTAFNGPSVPYDDEFTICVPLEDGYAFVGAVTTTDDPSVGCRSYTVAPDILALSVGFSVEPAPTNAPPTAVVSGPYLVPVGGSVTLDASASTDPDGDLLSHHWAVDGGSLDDGGIATPTFTAGTAAGIFDVTVTVDDGNGGTDTATSTVVVYDPDGGFVTGGGWYESTAASCLDASVCGDRAGRASFGFVAKYKQGRTVPEGQTHLTFEAGDLTFSSSAYEALVVSGDEHAQYWGTGSVDGVDGYRFRVTASDRDQDPDTFRFRLWAPDAVGGDLVYDNGAAQVLGGGEIRIHSGGRGK